MDSNVDRQRNTKVKTPKKVKNIMYTHKHYNRKWLGTKNGT